MQTTTVLKDITKQWVQLTYQGERIRLSVAAVVGGMSEHKQRRLLSTSVHIVVATPGRLAEIMDDDTLSAFQDLSRLKYLVVDEADRIMEEGHYAEVSTSTFWLSK